MFRRIATLICIALVSVIIAGCSEEGFGVGWDYQDMDGDGIRNGIDPDVDGDGVPNTHDVWPLNPYAW